MWTINPVLQENSLRRMALFGSWARNEQNDVLMATLENATNPKALANLAKHLAFTRCGELNLYGLVDAQLSLMEGELLAGNMPAS